MVIKSTWGMLDLVIGTLAIYVGINVLGFLWTIATIHFGIPDALRIQDRPHPWDTLWNRMPLILFNQLVLMALTWAALSNFGHLFEIELPSVGTIILQLIAIHLLDDLVFYWWHRLLHETTGSTTRFIGFTTRHFRRSRSNTFTYIHSNGSLVQQDHFWTDAGIWDLGFHPSCYVLGVSDSSEISMNWTSTQVFIRQLAVSYPCMHLQSITTCITPSPQKATMGPHSPSGIMYWGPTGVRAKDSRARTMEC